MCCGSTEQGDAPSGIETNGFVVADDGLVVVFRIKINCATVGQRQYVRWIEPDRLIVFGKRVLIIFFNPVLVAADAVTGSAGGIQAERLFIILQRALEISAICVCNTAIAHGLRLVGRRFASGFDNRRTGTNSLVQCGTAFTGAPIPVLRLRMGRCAEENRGNGTCANGKKPPVTIQNRSYGYPTHPAPSSGRIARPDCTESRLAKQAPVVAMNKGAWQWALCRVRRGPPSPVGVIATACCRGRPRRTPPPSRF